MREDDGMHHGGSSEEEDTWIGSRYISEVELMGLNKLNFFSMIFNIYFLMN